MTEAKIKQRAKTKYIFLKTLKHNSEIPHGIK